MSFYGLDFETYSDVDLPRHGLHQYIMHPSFRPLIASVATTTTSGGVTSDSVKRFDFVTGDAYRNLMAKKAFLEYLQDKDLAAHNVSFERAVLARMGVPYKEDTIVDTAAIARMLGASSRLEAAAPQLVGLDKLEAGKHLIQKFSIPREDGSALIDHLDEWTEKDWEDWELYGEYCDQDALASHAIAEEFYDVFWRDDHNELVTQRMNEVGWPVDLDLVRRMKKRYEENLQRIEEDFRAIIPAAADLNMRSTTQLRAWTKERGILMHSFDELSVSKAIPRMTKRLEVMRKKPNVDQDKVAGLEEVLAMLQVKQQLGGTSLTKLDRILELTDPDDRLRYQYVHVGAGQTYRTSGRGVQMQNLKRIGRHLIDTDTDIDQATNEQLAANLRQVFTASHPEGKLIVGDLAAIESRGLAYLAGAEWKLDAFREQKDMYKVLASQMMNVSYEAVTPEQRQTGKVGELSCGYGAGPGAVRSFAEKMGTELSEIEAAGIVSDWRDANTEVVELWSKLDDILKQALHQRTARGFTAGPSQELEISIAPSRTPDSVLQVDPSALNLELKVISRHTGRIILRRTFPGAFFDGRDICYMRASSLKSGALWLTRWTKNGQTGRYKLYGGKLTGILTQSLCREIFFESMVDLSSDLEAPAGPRNVQLIGQFHDELVLDWSPVVLPGRKGHSFWSLDETMNRLEGALIGRLRWAPDLPLAATVQADYRYTK